MKTFRREKTDLLVEGLSEVGVLEGRHLNCISVHELVYVFHQLLR